MWLSFEDVAENQLEMKSRYAVRYTGIGPNGEVDWDGWVKRCWPNFGKGLRFLGNSEDFRKMQIHQDDVSEFIRRVKSYFAAA